MSEMAATASSRIVPEEKPGGIARIDSGKLFPRPRHLVMRIESVHYYRTQKTGLNCAVLINTQFDLDRNDKLAFAKLPLKVFERQGQDAAADITSCYPNKEEQYKIQEQAASRTVHATPKFNIKAVGAGVGLSGVGVDKSTSGTLASFISLEPVLDEREDCPTILNWKFKNEHGIYYPSQIKLLAIASKKNTKHLETWFPFQLRIEWDLYVDLHNEFGISDSIVRLVAKIAKHEGWCFQIKGKYQDEVARDALVNAQKAQQATSDMNEIVGLYPAMRALEEGNKNWTKRKGTESVPATATVTAPVATA